MKRNDIITIVIMVVIMEVIVLLVSSHIHNKPISSHQHFFREDVVHYIPAIKIPTSTNQVPVPHQVRKIFICENCDHWEFDDKLTPFTSLVFGVDTVPKFRTGSYLSRGE